LSSVHISMSPYSRCKVRKLKLFDYHNRFSKGLNVRISVRVGGDERVLSLWIISFRQEDSEDWHLIVSVIIGLSFVQH
jgi:hypothetical protein